MEIFRKLLENIDIAGLVEIHKIFVYKPQPRSSKYFPRILATLTTIVKVKVSCQVSCRAKWKQKAHIYKISLDFKDANIWHDECGKFWKNFYPFGCFREPESNSCYTQQSISSTPYQRKLTETSREDRKKHKFWDNQQENWVAARDCLIVVKNKKIKRKRRWSWWKLVERFVHIPISVVEDQKNKENSYLFIHVR